MWFRGLGSGFRVCDLGVKGPSRVEVYHVIVITGEGISFPDPREDLESRSPNLGPYTTKGTLEEPPLRDLLFGSSRGCGL